MTKKRREFDDTFSLLSHREELFFLALLEKKENVTQHEKTFLFRVLLLFSFISFLHTQQLIDDTRRRRKMEIEEAQLFEEEEEEEERGGGENKSSVRYVTVEIKSDDIALFDDDSRETDDFGEKKKRKIRIDAKKTVKDLKVDASKRLISESSLHKPTNPKYICFLYQGKVLKEDEETLENALGLNREKLRYLSSSDEEDVLDEERRRGNERKEDDEDEVKIVHMIVRKSNRELEREREEREKRRLEARETSDDNRSRSSNVDRNVLASAQPNATSTPQQQQQQQQVQQSPPPGAVMVSPMVINAYNAAYNAAFRSLRPNATVIPRSPGLAYVQTNAALEQSTFFQRQENVTSQIGGSGASGTNVAGATADAAPNVPQGAEALGAALARANNNNNNPDIDFDPNQPYQRIVRRGEDGEEIVEVIRVIQFRIDLKLMFKLILITAFACQDASRKKMAMYITAAVIGYLYQTGVLESVWDALFGAYLPPENEAQQGGGADARANNNNNNNNNNNARDEGNNNNNNRNNIRNGRRQRYRRPPHVAGYTDAMPQSWFGELKIFAYSFLASLFPAWRVPNLQQQQQQRLQNEQNNDNNNPQRHLHQD